LRDISGATAPGKTIEDYRAFTNFFTVKPFWVKILAKQVVGGKSSMPIRHSGVPARFSLVLSNWPVAE
jgi:hypothetical protein